MKNVLLILLLSSLATLAAVLVTSQFFPQVYTSHAEITVDAPLNSTLDILCDARTHLEWNPWIADQETVSATEEQVVVTWQIDENREQNVTLRVVECDADGEVIVVIDDNPSDPGNHRWRLRANGPRTDIEWGARGTQRKWLLGRFSNMMVSRWVEERGEEALVRLKATIEAYHVSGATN